MVAAENGREDMPAHAGVETASQGLTYMQMLHAQSGILDAFDQSFEA